MGTQDITLVTERTQGWPAEATDDDAPHRGTSVGRYLVLDVIGRGGMGIVVRAYDPQLDRPLAIKRLRSRSTPADSPAHARLRREARTLARLSDPHIVTLYDVGEDEAGLYIAMELVEGQDLAAWLQQGPHPWPQVVARMAAAGRGLAAAHRVGVVHRDFKPGNVLLGDDGRVTVTDFGLARPDAFATEAPSTGDSSSSSSAGAPVLADPLITRFGMNVGTPAYMAPEQHAGQPATTAADQYAFCVTLHEALYGRRPFPVDDEARLAELERRGLEVEPGQGLPMPIPARLRRVVQRGLQAEPSRRYPTMDALLHDLEPGPRRRWGTTAALSVVLATVAVAGVARSGAREDPCARSDDALAEIWTPQRRDGLQAELSADPRPYAAHAAQTVPEALDAWAERWTTTHRTVCEATWQRGEQSAAALDVRMACLDDGRRALEATVSALTEGDDAAVVHARELVLALPTPEACRERSPVPHGRVRPSDSGGKAERVRTRLAQLDTLRRTGRGERARSEAETLLREVGPGLDPETATSLYYLLGVLRDDAGDFGGAQQALQESARLARRRGDARREADAFIELTRIVGTHQHDREQGELLGALALTTLQAADGDPAERARALLELGEVAFRAGDDATASTRWTEAEALRRQHLGEHDVRVAQVSARLAGVDLNRRALDAARARLEEVIDRYRETFGPEHPRLAAPQGNLGFVLSAQGEHEAALTQMRAALSIAERSRGPHHPQVAGGHDAIGQILLTAGRPEPAEAEFMAAIDGFERSLGPEHPAVATALLGLGSARLARGRADEAVAPLERALTVADSVDLPPIQIAQTRLALARALQEREPARAEALARSALAVYDARLPPDDDRWIEARAWRSRHPLTPGPSASSPSSVRSEPDPDATPEPPGPSP